MALVLEDPAASGFAGSGGRAPRCGDAPCSACLSSALCVGHDVVRVYQREVLEPSACYFANQKRVLAQKCFHQQNCKHEAKGLVVEVCVCY